MAPYSTEMLGLVLLHLHCPWSAALLRGSLPRPRSSKCEFLCGFLGCDEQRGQNRWLLDYDLVEEIQGSNFICMVDDPAVNM